MQLRQGDQWISGKLGPGLYGWCQDKVLGGSDEVISVVVNSGTEIFGSICVRGCY